MNVLVDTSIWSLALRRQIGDLNSEQRTARNELAEIIRDGRAQLIGVVRQELLSGIREHTQFNRLRQHLRAFDDVGLTVADYEAAAEASNRCRAAGTSGSTIDFLLCAVAIRRGWLVFTGDKDFAEYAKHIPVRLHSLAKS